MNLNLQTPHKQRGWIQFAVGAVFGLAGLVQGRKSRKAQNAARRQQQQINRLRNAQNARDYFRKFKIAQAEAIINPLASGAEGSSRAQATVASQRAQAGQASREFEEAQALGEAASANLNRAATASFNAGIYSQLTSFALSAQGGDFLKNLPSRLKGE